MRILGVGTDLVDLARMARLLDRHGSRFLARCFRPGEIPADREEDPATLGGRWAAKEALLKALGADVRGVPYRDIEVTPAVGGPPGIILHGKARDIYDGAGGAAIHLSISHEREHALAFVIVTG